MKNRQTTKLKTLLLLLAVVALLLGMLPGQARAQDSDRDGFSDQEEIEGITLSDGSSFPGLNSNVPREQRLDPDTVDLFVMLVRAKPSNIPLNSLEFVTKSLAEGGLGITIHEIYPAQAGPDREITPTQKAVRITESLNPTGEVLGIANYGTPNQLDEAAVFSERIKNHINSVCANADYCGDNTGMVVGPDALAELYIKHTIAHEIGHTLSLATDYNVRFGGYHYKSGSQVIMEQSVKYTSKSKGKVVTFYVSTDYAAPDQQGAVFK